MNKLFIQLFQLLSAIISCLFHTLPRTKYLFHFLSNYYSVYKIGSQTRLGIDMIDVGVKETSEKRRHKFKCHLNDASVVIYLQH